MPTPPRRLPASWSVEDIGGCFLVKASNDRPLIFIYYGEGVARRSIARLFTRDAARRIAAGIAKLFKHFEARFSAQPRLKVSFCKKDGHSIVHLSD